MEMTIELIEGFFTKEDAIKLVQDLIQTKIKFHENKIGSTDQLEDVQQREKKIKKLSETMQNLRVMLADLESVDLNGVIKINYA